MESDDLIVRFEKPLSHGAREVFRIYPSIKAELEKTLRQPVDFRSHIVLVKEKDTFRKIAGTDMIVAFAVPLDNLVVIDYSKMGISPFRLDVTLKHEMCHLLLHRHVKKGLPKWFDEGVSQWVTGGIAEIIRDDKGSLLSQAALSRGLLNLDDLRDRFPGDRRTLMLAYEESKSIIEYVVKTFGPEKLIAILDLMKNGESFEKALERTLSLSLTALEKGWQRDLGKRTSWFIFIAHNLYEIIFFLLGLITAFAFFRLMVKRHLSAKGRDEDDEES